MKQNQLHMFPQGDDLPLFSGTPQTVPGQTFTPAVIEPQISFAQCPACRDTGITTAWKNGRKTTVYCLCVKGQQAKQRAQREADEAKP